MNQILLLTILIFPAMAWSHISPPAQVAPIPSTDQMAWQQLEFYAFVHFTMNTFTGKEWGYGDESPELFNPEQLDCRQWARVCKEAGMKGIIFTAKHHDGFCLWPSKYTEHSVKNSPWKDGRGDIVRELSEACEEYGLKLGLYLSPWDRNHADYGKPEYISYYRHQLKELLTEYGEVFEVWFDGANGGTGYYGGADENRQVDKLTYYDWKNTIKLVREWQPHAIIFSDAGPDCRWVGNERGFGYPSTWSNLMRDEVYAGMPEYVDSYSMGQENGTHWVPAEADVSIRPGWFYHPEEDDQIKSLNQLLDIYYKSIGRNCNLLLNLPADQRGLIHENDVQRLQELATHIKRDFEHDLAVKGQATASNERSPEYAPAKVLDGDPDSYWATDDGVTNAWIEIMFDDPITFNRLLVQENIALGQRVKAFTVEVKSGNTWLEISSERTIGYKRILRLPQHTTTALRFHVKDAKAAPTISNIGLYLAPAPYEIDDKTGDR